jgi:ferrous iron transport protein B
LYAAVILIVWGFGIFLGILFLLFQAIFSWAEVPMDLIDGLFQYSGSWIADNLPAGKLNDLFAKNSIINSIH